MMLRRLVPLIIIFTLNSVILWGQDRYERGFDNIITIKPLGFLSIYDPGIELGWLHQTNKNFYLSLNYRFSHKLLDFATKPTRNQFSHTIDGTLYFPFVDDENLFFSLGPKLSYGYRNFYDTYIESDWQTGIAKVYPTTLVSHTVKFLGSFELLILYKNRISLQLGLDGGLTVRHSTFSSYEPPDGEIFILAVGLSESGTFYVPHLRYKLGVGIQLGKRYYK